MKGTDLPNHALLYREASFRLKGDRSSHGELVESSGMGLGMSVGMFNESLQLKSGFPEGGSFMDPAMLDCWAHKF